MAFSFKNLEGQNIKLAPLSRDHYGAMIEALSSMPDSVWDYLPQKLSGSKAIESWLTMHLSQKDEKLRFPYAIFSENGDRLLGSSSYLGLDERNRSIEIGWTWLAPEVWGSKVNLECKLLLLEQAFSTLNCVRVQFKTDHSNLRSRRALEKIGAKYEGTFRKHMLMSTGRWRDSAFYSVIVDEWPKVREEIEKKLV